MITKEQIIETLKNGGYIKKDNKGNYLFDGTIIDEDLVDELFDEYNLATYMNLKDCTLYTINPKYCYDYHYDKWVRTTTYKGE